MASIFQRSRHPKFIIFSCIVVTYLYATRSRPSQDLVPVSRALDENNGSPSTHPKEYCATENCPTHPCTHTEGIIAKKRFKELSQFGQFLTVCGRQFMFSNTKKTWSGARDSCCALGMELVMFRYKELQTCLSDTITNYAETPFYKTLTERQFWTAGSEGSCVGQFAWCGQDVEFRKDDLRWAPGARQHEGGCIFMDRISNHSLLDKGECDSKKFFLCSYRERDTYKENRVLRECRKVQKLDLDQIEPLYDVVTDESRITYNMKCFVKCAGVLVKSFPPSTFMKNIHDERFMLRFFGGFNDGIDPHRINKTITECSKNLVDITDECILAYEYYKCAMKADRRILFKIIDKKAPTIDFKYKPPLLCSPFVRQCIMTNSLTCKFDSELKISIQEKGSFHILESHSKKQIFISNYEESINEANAYRSCCGLGMKLFEPESKEDIENIARLIRAKNKENGFTRANLLIGEIQQVSWNESAWCSTGARVVNLKGLNLPNPSASCAPYIDGIAIDSKRHKVVRINRKKYYLDFDMASMDFRTNLKINHFACQRT